MRLAVLADEARAVHAEHDRQRLDRDVVDDVVVGALQERRVDRARPGGRRASPGRRRRSPRVPRRCRRRRSASGCALANAPVPVPLGIAAVIATSVGALGAELGESRAEDRGVGRVAGRRRCAACRWPDRDRAEARATSRACSPAGKPFPFCVMTCTSRGPFMSRTARERVEQRIDVVAVDRAEVAEAELLEQHARREERLDALLPLPHERADARQRPGASSTSSPIAERTRL